jgi:hypothetical protein
VTTSPARTTYGYVHLDDPSGHALKMHRILSRVVKQTVEKATITRGTKSWILDSDECDQLTVSIDRNAPGSVMIQTSEESPTWPFMLRIDRVAQDLIPRADADDETISSFTATMIRNCTAAIIAATTRFPEDEKHALAQELVAIRMALTTLEAAARREGKGRTPTATEWRIVAPSPFHHATVTHDRTQRLETEMPNAIGLRIHVPGPSDESDGQAGAPYIQVVESWRRITPSQYSTLDVMALHARLAEIEDILSVKP